MNGFEAGFRYFQKSTGENLSAFAGADYVSNVNAEIDTLVRDLNAFQGYRTGSDKLQGDIAEFWHADTFNINAAVRGSHSHAHVDRSHDFASADVSTSSGDRFGLKYYKDGVSSAKAQAKSVFERFREYQAQGGKDPLDKFLEDRGFDDLDSILNDPIYAGQKRLIPADQLKEAVEWLERKIAKESVTRPDQVARYQDTLKLLTSKIRDGKGAESIELTRGEAQQLADLAKEGKVDAKQLGLTTEELITYEYILQQAFKAGLSAAAVSAVLKLAPEVLKAIQYLIENGEISSRQFKAMGLAAVKGTAEGFLRGTLSAGITAACKAGLFGTAAKSVNPNAVAMAVVLAIDTMKNAYAVVCGRMSRQEMANELIKESFVASASLAGGMLLQSILPAIPVLGFMLGSFVGSIAGGVVYSGITKLVLSFCVDTGFTMFGLVTQDYTLPEDILKEIGLSVFEYTKFEPSRFEPTQFQFMRFEPTRFEPTRFQTYFLRRGVIGIHTVGYLTV